MITNTYCCDFLSSKVRQYPGIRRNFFCRHLAWKDRFIPPENNARSVSIFVNTIGLLVRTMLREIKYLRHGAVYNGFAPRQYLPVVPGIVRS